MVQRIQTVYLLLVVIFSLLAIFSFPVWTDATKTAILARSGFVGMFFGCCRIGVL